MAADDVTPTGDTPPPAPLTGRQPPPPIIWETEVSTRSQDPSSMSTAALDVVRTVIHGDRDGE